MPANIGANPDGVDLPFSSGADLDSRMFSSMNGRPRLMIVSIYSADEIPNPEDATAEVQRGGAARMVTSPTSLLHPHV
jgi:hypothetical protein